MDRVEELRADLSSIVGDPVAFSKALRRIDDLFQGLSYGGVAYDAAIHVSPRSYHWDNVVFLAQHKNSFFFQMKKCFWDISNFA